MLLLLVLLCLGTLCAHVSASSDLPEVPPMPVIYEISTRPWLYELSGKYGKNISRLRDIPVEELQALADQGVHYVWFMGVWHLGPYGLNHDRTDPNLLATYAQELPDYTMDDIIGSPYAVTNYTLNPQLGDNGDDDITWLRDTVHSLGMRLLLDFVPNHSACDSPWIDTNIDYYIRAPKDQSPPYDSTKYLPNGVAFGNSPGSSSPWTDTAQLNYWNPDTRTMMQDNLLHLSTLADGVRCDMAYIILNDDFWQTWSTQLQSWGWSRPSTEFWDGAISTVKAKNPDFIFVAEVYGDAVYTLQSLGFDFTYDKEVLDRLESDNLDYLRAYISSQSESYFDHSCHFTENHDEPRAVATFGSWEVADAAAFVALSLPGMKLYFEDQWNGFKNKLDVHLRRATSEPAITDVQNAYDTFNRILNNETFNRGKWYYATVGSSSESWRLVAWRYSYTPPNSSTTWKRLVVVNFSDTSGSGAIVLPDAQTVGGSDTVVVTELWSGVQYERSVSQMRSSGLFVVVDPWAAQIFEYP